MASFELLVLTIESSPDAVVPALAVLPHRTRRLRLDAAAVGECTGHDAVLVDARRDLVRARDVCRILSRLHTWIPVIAVVPDGALVGVNADWGLTDVVLPTVGPAELDARLRLRCQRRPAADTNADTLVAGDLTIEEATYTARLRKRRLELTYKEFELLKYLVQNQGRVFTRGQLLQEVWGYDFFGGTRTVDVHVRRLRAKLGAEHEAMIGTVRGVGYKFDASARATRSAGEDRESAQTDETSRTL